MPADNGSELIILAVPVFLFLMLLEWTYFYFKKERVYSLKDTLSNISCGAGQALFDSLALILLLSVYSSLQKSLGIVPIEMSPLSFFISFVAVDLSYYAYHRLSHKVPFMWAIHVAHHSSSEYNFSVGLRQAWFHKITAFPFYLVLVVTGLPANLIGIVIATHASLQLLTHTKAFKKELPILRWIFVTPSHHRVHHGVQKQYWDKNFSGIFSFWDRLFKSYSPEVEPVQYGISPQLKTYNPWNINSHFWHELFPKLPLFTQIKNINLKFSLPLLFIFFLILFFLTVLYLFAQNQLGLWVRIFSTASLMAGYGFWGALMDTPNKESSYR
jgi:alkylglycerol monooxygenase